MFACINIDISNLVRNPNFIMFMCFVNCLKGSGKMVTFIIPPPLCFIYLWSKMIQKKLNVSLGRIFILS